MRAFIAIDLKKEIKDSLARLLHGFRRLNSEVKWVQENSFHLTLKFLGEISEADASAVADVMEQVARTHQPFALECRGVGFFPEKGTPRVFWIGIEPSPSLISLQEEVEASLEKMGFPRENRPFHPHLTLGRVKGSRGLELVQTELKKHSEDDFGRMEVDHLTLFQSILKPSGAEYHVIREVKLG